MRSSAGPRSSPTISRRLSISHLHLTERQESGSQLASVTRQLDAYLDRLLNVSPSCRTAGPRRSGGAAACQACTGGATRHLRSPPFNNRQLGTRVGGRGPSCHPVTVTCDDGQTTVRVTTVPEVRNDPVTPSGGPLGEVTSRGTKLLALLLGMTLSQRRAEATRRDTSSSKSTNQNATRTAPVMRSEDGQRWCRCRAGTGLAD